MKLGLQDFVVKPGDPVQPFVEKLIRFLPDLLHPYTTSSKVRLQSSPQGTAVIVDADPAPFSPRFKVSASQGFVTVKPGFVNDTQLPTIKGVPLDGIMKDGKVLPVPRINITKDAPNDDLRSWVVLQVTVDATGKVDETLEDWATVKHVNVLEPLEERVGWQPLAMLTWSDAKTVKRVDQISMHNLKHVYVKAVPAKGQPGRHYFWAV